ncbi:helix-turn-helix domain-containing protein [Tepidibacter hydrothermalis]|uniref:Helix-turn-helix transcriptional regulator n=1 Tax=Tepidibacter hydrothermalis TaxID=3036126 RepID=A0ABY8E787_9FIRM|nr:helix-turn-helix transcriptional regulator [Tepidibacter hydrothermalis]WFD08750.1 helix-turn-helix transcriptional regulator [Tepidibacter hydrothermalis]
MDFGDRLKNLRENNNLSREDLSKSLNISYSAVAKYETNVRFPDKDTLNKIADYFDCSLDYLLGRTNNPKGSIKPEGNLHKDNTEYKAYDEIFQRLRERLEEEGIVEKDQPVSKEIIEMLLKFGSGAAIEILKARNKEDM